MRSRHHATGLPTTRWRVTAHDDNREVLHVHKVAADSHASAARIARELDRDLPVYFHQTQKESDWRKERAKAKRAIALDAAQDQSAPTLTLAQQEVLDVILLLCDRIPKGLQCADIIEKLDRSDASRIIGQLKRKLILDRRLILQMDVCQFTPAALKWYEISPYKTPAEVMRRQLPAQHIFETLNPHKTPKRQRPTPMPPAETRRTPIRAADRKVVYERDGHRCQNAYCNPNTPEPQREALSIDHIIPVIHGGPNCVDNYQTLCLSCNVRKRTKSQTEFVASERLRAQRAA